MENFNSYQKTYWCFTCSKECNITDYEEGPVCNLCKSSFVEEIEREDNNSDNPKDFIPEITTYNTTNTNNISNNLTNTYNTTPNNRMFFLQLSRNHNGQVQVISNQGINELSQWMQQFNNLFSVNHSININSFNFTNNFFPNIFNRPNNDQQFENLLNYLMMNDPNRHGNPPASRKVVEELERIKITEDNLNGFKDLNCPLCMEDCVLYETLIKMNCSHSYHEKCILEWLKITNTCPICRDELITDDPDYENRKNERRRILRSYPNNNQNQQTTNTSSNGNSNRNVNHPNRHARR